MYLSKLTIENFRCFGEKEKRFEVCLTEGLTALVGENDSGKTAVIDAIRFALGTTDQDWYTRLEDTDFHGEDTKRQIRIVCKFEGLTSRDKRAFIEYLTYDQEPKTDPVLFVNWTAKDTGHRRKGRPFRRSEVHSGEKGDGPPIVQEARDLLRATYLRPLRDAEQAMSAGRGSRLAQVLQESNQIKTGTDALDDKEMLKQQKLSVLGIANLVNDLLAEQKGVEQARNEIDRHLEGLSLSGDDLKSKINVSGTNATDDVLLRQLLEKLDLSLGGDGKLGLGSNNLLFMACEFLLLDQEDEGSKLLLIEEPEAHLHAQRQLRAMKFLQDQAKDKDKGIQIIVTTHSPNLASAIDLNNIVMIHNKRAYSMAKGQTELEPSDYRFLQRFLDVTKANLFFARGVMIVEGDAENILLPTLARLVGRDFTEHGVSIVNVGGTGLRRYARVFLRKDVKDEEKQLRIPVACVTDMDVMPDCAPVIIGKLKKNEEWPVKAKRRWRAKRDFGDDDALKKFRQEKVDKASGQCVKTLVSDEWTLEYDLALGPKDKNGNFKGGLAEDVFVAACLADNDDTINNGTKNASDVATEALEEFQGLKQVAAEGECTAAEVLATRVYAKFVGNGVSKAIAAQYLAERLDAWKKKKENLAAADLQAKLPKYLVQAIQFVTQSIPSASTAHEQVRDDE